MRCSECASVRFETKGIMATVTGGSPARPDLYGSSRYGSTIAIAVGLFAFSALAMAIFFSGDAPSIEGMPAYLFSIPRDTDKEQAREALNGPLAVAAFGDRIAVTDSGAGRVKVYGWTGRYLGDINLTKVAGRGRKRAYPAGIVYDDEGRLFVSDIASDRISVFDGALQHLYSFPQEGEPGQLSQPVAMSVLGDELYVTDVGDSSVRVFGLDGTFQRRFASKDDRAVDLAFPNGVAATGDGTVYVADSNNRKVLRFDSEGRQQSVIAHGFGLPRGVAVDGIDRLHVVDTFGHEVAVFGGSGKYLFSYGSRSDNERGVLAFPNGIAVDSSTARIYIADRGANRVLVFGWGQ